MRRLAAIDWFLLGTTLPIFLTGLVMSVICGVRGDFVLAPFLATSAPDKQSYPVVERILSSPTAEASALAVGDRLLRLEGSDLRGTLHTAVAQGSSTLRLDPARSRLVVHVFPAGILSPALHEHHLVPDHWEGTLSGDGDHPEQVRAEIHVAADSLRDQQPALSPADTAQVEEQVRGPQVLNAAKYPTIRFVVTGLAVQQRDEESSLRGELTGTLELHGTRRALQIPVRARWSPAQLWVDGNTSFKQSDFGIVPYTRLFGTIAVQDRVTVEFAIVAVPQQ